VTNHRKQNRNGEIYRWAVPSCAHGDGIESDSTSDGVPSDELTDPAGLPAGLR
jgi:hypothetical protein